MKKKPPKKTPGSKLFPFRDRALIPWAVTVGIMAFLFFGAPQVFSLRYDTGGNTSAENDIQQVLSEVIKVKHLPTPEPLKAIYMTQCVVGTPSFRDKLVNLIDETELNSVVIDIKDYSGGIGFRTDNPKLSEFVSDKCGAWDIREFIERLHDKGIYVIGRITVFQDPLYAPRHVEVAVQKESDKTQVWKDYKGLSFIDAGAKSFWDYIVELSKESYALGFDEINYDYIRFPSDGNMTDIYYPISEQRILADPDYGKADVIEDFFKYLSTELASSTDAVLSADLFGMTTTNPDDLNIGQILERALPYFDYVMPMVYPSHYPKTFNGYDNPANYPYEVVKYSMDSAIEKINALNVSLASTTGETVSIHKIRPWLQDFNLGAIYTADKVRTQIQAVYDAGLTSWALWDAGNTYTKEALLEDIPIETSVEN